MTTDEGTMEQFAHRNWLTERYPLLLESNFCSNLRPCVAVTPLMIQQLLSMCQESELTSEDGRKARQLLGYILMNRCCSTGCLECAKVSEIISHTLIRLLCDAKFAEEVYPFIACVLAGSEATDVSVRKTVLSMIQIALPLMLDLDATMLRKLSDVLFRALRLEMMLPRREQSILLQSALIDLLTQLPLAEIGPCLGAYAHSNLGHPKVLRAAASEAERTNSYMRVWQITPADKLASCDERADRLKTILSNRSNLEEATFIESVFSQLKGLDIVSSTDERLVVLHNLMLSKSYNSLCFSVAFGTAQIYKVTRLCATGRLVVQLLSAEAIKGECASRAADAIHSLTMMKSLSTSVKQEVERSMTSQNLAFILNRLRAPKTHHTVSTL